MQNQLKTIWFKNPSAQDLQGCTRKFQIETTPPGSLPPFFIEYEWGPRKTPPGEIWAILNRRKYFKKFETMPTKKSPETEMPDFRRSWFFKFNVLTKLRNEENCCETRTLLWNEDFLTLANRKKGCESRKMVAKSCGCESRKVAKAGSLTLKNRGVAKAWLLRNEESCEIMRPPLEVKCPLTDSPQAYELSK